MSMFTFFKKKKPPEKRDLEEVIFDVAEHNADHDFHVLYDLMRTRMVCVPVDLSSIPAGLESGVEYVTSPGDEIRVKHVTGPNNLILIPAATKEDAPLLADGYVYMKWVDFLDLALKLDETVFGVLLQGKTSWVVFDRERIKYILNRNLS